MNPFNFLNDHLKRQSLIPAHSIGVVAVSGGADSMALLHALMILQRKRPFSLYAATFDHGLRGAQSAQEASGVASVCAAWGIPHFTGHGALDPSASAVEARARTARYAFLASVARQVGADWVATGHHADDQAETVLMHAIRGAGLRGLRGMRPSSSLPGAPAIPLLRPLLGVHHADIIAYCEYHNIWYADDPTNQDPSYRRNWARLVALPTLSHANPDVNGALGRLAEAAALDDEFIESLAAPLKQAAHRRDGRVSVPRWMLSSAHLALRIRVVAWACEQLKSSEPPTFEQLRAAAGLPERETGGGVELSGGVRARLEHDALVIERTAVSVEDDMPGGFGLRAGERFSLSLGEKVRLPGGANAHILPTTGAGIVDFYAQAGQLVELRTPISGERIKPFALHGHTKKLKEWLIDRKIPQRWRTHLPILAVDGEAVALWDGFDWWRFWSNYSANHSLVVQ